MEKRRNRNTKRKKEEIILDKHKGRLLIYVDKSTSWEDPHAHITPGVFALWFSALFLLPGFSFTQGLMPWWQ
jgi:hypothetical protein